MEAGQVMTSQVVGVATGVWIRVSSVLLILHLSTMSCEIT